MDYRDFGTSGLKVSALGFGAGQLGDLHLPESDAESLLHLALDLGITLIDTAGGYGASEERIGKYLSKRRDEFVLSTKVGYGVQGVPDWTHECILKGVDAARKRLKSDVLDIVHLHSPASQTMFSNGVIDALEECVQAGKVRVAAYAGDNEDLLAAIGCGRFGSFMGSINVCDQKVLHQALPLAKERGMGVIAKRPIANAPWRFVERPVGHYVENYWGRFHKMGFNPKLDWNDIALRFTAYTWGVDSVIVGTTNPQHLSQNAELIEHGILDANLYGQLIHAFNKAGSHWNSET